MLGNNQTLQFLVSAGRFDPAFPTRLIKIGSQGIKFVSDDDSHMVIQAHVDLERLNSGGSGASTPRLTTILHEPLRFGSYTLQVCLEESTAYPKGYRDRTYLEAEFDVPP